MNVITSPQKISKMAKKYRVKSSKKTTTRGEVVRMGEMPTPERMAKDADFGGVSKLFEPESPNSPVMILKFKVGAVDWLQRYKRKGFIDDVEYAAGLMFRKAWLNCVCGIRTHDSLLSQYGNYNNGVYDAAPIARVGSEKIYRLCLAKLSYRQKLAVIAVCGQDEALGCKERVQTLRRGLEILSRKSSLLTESDNNFLAREMEKFMGS